MASVVQFPVGLRLLSGDDLSESRAARDRRSARALDGRERRDEEWERRLKRHGARAGAVIGEDYATYQWLEVIEHFGLRNDIGQMRHIMCDRCLDRELCDWSTPKTGCDTQINVTRFYEGKTAPMYRPEKDDPDDEQETVPPQLDALHRAFKAMSDAALDDNRLCTPEGLLRAALGRVMKEDGQDGGPAGV
jgi:hypothetical protein